MVMGECRFRLSGLCFTPPARLDTRSFEESSEEEYSTSGMSALELRRVVYTKEAVVDCELQIAPESGVNSTLTGDKIRLIATSEPHFFATYELQSSH